MNLIVKRTLGLAAFIILLAVSLWAAVYYKDYSNLNTKIVEQSQTVQNIETEQENIIDWAQLESAEKDKITLSLVTSTQVTNPFVFNATSTFQDNLTWVLEDKLQTFVASGTIPAASASQNQIWYNNPTETCEGWFFIKSADRQIIQKIHVNLECQKQTVEIYLRPAYMSNCSSVESAKRQIASTGDNQLNYYEAAIRELLKGPNTDEQERGLTTMIPGSVNVLRIGKDSSGRIIADLDTDLQNAIELDCFYQIAKKQIQKTLQTVPLTGRSLEGMIMFNGKNID
ncbi:MAG: hypothetical protein ACOYUZ_05920 [Patescibacteria group bacterium]